MVFGYNHVAILRLREATVLSNSVASNCIGKADSLVMVTVMSFTFAYTGN